MSERSAPGLATNVDATGTGGHSVPGAPGGVRTAEPPALTWLLGWWTVPAAAVVLLLMAHTALNATMRSMGNPMGGSLEVSQYWYMPAIAFFAFVATQRAGQHIEATLLFEHLPRRVRREHLVIGNVLVVALSLLIAWFSLGEALKSMDIGQTSGSGSVPIWPAKFLVPLAYGLLSIQLLYETVRIFVRDDRSDANDLEGESPR